MPCFYTATSFPCVTGPVSHGGRAAERVQLLDKMSAVEAFAYSQNFPDAPVLLGYQQIERVPAARQGRIAFSLHTLSKTGSLTVDCDYTVGELRKIHSSLVAVTLKEHGVQKTADRLADALRRACSYSEVAQHFSTSYAMTFAAALATSSGEHGRQLLRGRVRSCNVTATYGGSGGTDDIEFCFGYAPRPKCGKTAH